MLSQFLLKLEFFLKDMLVKDWQDIKKLQELDDEDPTLRGVSFVFLLAIQTIVLVVRVKGYIDS